MTEMEFWSIVEACRGDDGDEEHAERLKGRLRELDDRSVQDFDELLSVQIERAYNWDLRAVAYIGMGWCSDDGFEYFRRWMVSLGRRAFERALNAPESLGTHLENIDYPSFELFGAAPWEVMDERGIEPPERASPRGEPWEESDLPRRFPGLWKQYFSRHDLDSPALAQTQSAPRQTEQETEDSQTSPPHPNGATGDEDKPAARVVSEGGGRPRVRHPEFGVGEVLEEDSTLGTVLVSFDGVGEKWLFRRMARLETVDDD